MKKIGWSAVLISSIIMIALIILYTTPKPLQFRAEGIMYQLGEENKDFAKPVTIHVDGELKRSLLGARTFKGFIDMEGETIPFPMDERALTLTFGEFGDAQLTYASFRNGGARLYSYGGILINHDFSEFTIWKYSRDEDSSRGSWNPDDSYMISAPAATREEALAISNERMSDYLQGYVLK